MLGAVARLEWQVLEVTMVLGGVVELEWQLLEVVSVLAGEAAGTIGRDSPGEVAGLEW